MKTTVIEIHSKALQKKFKKTGEVDEQITMALEEAAMQLTKDLQTNVSWVNHHKVLIHLSAQSSPVIHHWDQQRVIAFCVSILSGIFHGYLGATDAVPFTVSFSKVNNAGQVRYLIEKAIKSTESNTITVMKNRVVGFPQERYHKRSFLKKLAHEGVNPFNLPYPYVKGALITHASSEIELHCSDDPMEAFDAWAVNNV